MKVLARLVVCTAVGWAVSGCMIGEEKGSEAKKKRNVAGIGNDSAFAFIKCERMLKKTSDNITDNDHIVSRSYQFEQNSCIRMSVGLYGWLERAEMRGEGMQMGSYRQQSSGSFDAAVRFMDRTGITCEDSGKSLKLTFPRHADDHNSDYGDVTVKCPSSSGNMRVNIGLNQHHGDKLTITITDDEIEPTIYQAFDTNRDGVITKHVKVVGEGGQEKLLLSR